MTLTKEDLEACGWVITLDREDRRTYEKSPWKITESMLLGSNPPYSYFAIYGPETWGDQVKDLLDIAGKLQWAKENTNHQHCKLCKSPFTSIGTRRPFCNKCHLLPEARKICPHKDKSCGEYTGWYCHDCGENIGF